MYLCHVLFVPIHTYTLHRGTNAYVRMFFPPPHYVRSNTGYGRDGDRHGGQSVLREGLGEEGEEGEEV